jgi:hypothetical protein
MGKSDIRRRFTAQAWELLSEISVSQQPRRWSRRPLPRQCACQRHRSLPHWIVCKVGIAGGCRRLRETEHLTDDDQALSAQCGNAGKRMAQVMQPHVIELGSLADTPPGLLQVD